MDKEQRVDPLVALAKSGVEEYVKYGRRYEVPDTLDPELSTKAGVFVCLKLGGDLRGCIGTIDPVEENIANEIVNNAVSAAFHDPRFFPVTEDELAELSYSVDVLNPAEPVELLNDLDPKVYGIIVTNGRKRGLLLPDLEGVDTVEDQVSIATRKAGIGPGEPVSIYRFTVTRHE